MSEKAYKAYSRAIEHGVEFLKKTLQAKTPKKKITLGKKTVASFRKALLQTKQLGMTKKTPFVYEYIVQMQATIAASYLELEKFPEAIKTFEEALESNAKSPQNIKQVEIRSFLFAELAKTNFSIKKLPIAEKFANKSLQLGSQKNFNQEDLLDLYIELNPIFIRSGSINKITKNYRFMVKLAKRDKRKSLKAQVYFAYGKYMYGIANDIAEAKKYLRKAQSLFGSVGLHKGLEEVNKFLEEKVNKVPEEMPDDKDFNST